MSFRKQVISSFLTFSRSGVLTATAGAGRYPAAQANAIAGVIAAVGTAPIGADLIVDVNKNGTTIFTTQANRPRIVGNTTESAIAVPDVNGISVGDQVSVDIDQIGSTTPGSDLTVALILI